MTVIERDECPKHGTEYGRAALARSEKGLTRFCGVPDCGRDLVAVEYVPAEQLQGAVEEREAYFNLMMRAYNSGILSRDLAAAIGAALDQFGRR